jgi:Protein of unknown function (DUF3810)
MLEGRLGRLWRSPWRFLILSLGVLLLALLLAALASHHPWATERLYSRGLYVVLITPLIFVTSHLPIGVLQWGTVGLLAFMWWRSLKGLHQAWCRQCSLWQLLGRGLRFAVGLGALGFGSLMMLWGLNLYRPPLRTLMGWDASLSSTDELVQLGRELALEAASQRPKEARTDWYLDVRPGFHQLQGRMPWLPSRLPLAKAPLVGRTFAYFGCTGVYGIWTAEPMVDGRVPGWYLPALRAHETAHGAGFVREDEANYLAWSACRIHPDAAARYSGALDALYTVRSRIAAVQPDRLAEVDSLLSSGCRDDIRALIRWFAVPKPTAKAASKVYDHVLKAQGQTQGLASYGLAVDLLLAERRKALQR